MKITGIDHIVLVVADVQRAIRFYESLLGMTAMEERPGKWALQFGHQKISLQDKESLPAMAQNTTPGSGNFCLLSHTPVERLEAELKQRRIEILAGPDERIGALGPIRSIYFRDPDGNLVEIANPLYEEPG